MSNSYFQKEDQFILNCATKYLAHSGRPTEAWRFPIISTYAGGATDFADPNSFDDFNEVTFIYAAPANAIPSSVGVVGTFGRLYEPLPLTRASFEGELTRYFSVTAVVPKAQKHLYRFIVDGQVLIDPVNPQQEAADNGVVWSRFFTDTYGEPIVLERWELAILSRLVAHLMPFRTGDAKNFLERFYNYLDRGAKDAQFGNIFRLDDSVGEINYIDNLLAREESHRLPDYKICLSIIDQVLRQRNPYTEPSRMSVEIYKDLYNEMSGGFVQGWDYQRYSSPQFFLYLLRRHVVTGAFCHPKYGGNAGAAGWAYLEETYRKPSPGPGVLGDTFFDWRRSLEPAAGGRNQDYRG